MGLKEPYLSRDDSSIFDSIEDLFHPIVSSATIVITPEHFSDIEYNSASDDGRDPANPHCIKHQCHDSQWDNLETIYFPPRIPFEGVGSKEELEENAFICHLVQNILANYNVEGHCGGN